MPAVDVHTEDECTCPGLQSRYETATGGGVSDGGQTRGIEGIDILPALTGEAFASNFS